MTGENGSKSLRVAVIDDHEVPLRWALERMRDSDVDVLVRPCRTEDEVIEAAHDADVVVMVIAPMTDRVLRALPRCSSVIKSGVGVDTIDLLAASDLGIAVANVGNYCAIDVAEHAFSLAVSLVRKLPLADALIRQGVWDRTKVIPVRRLSSHTLGIVGFGAIGSALAQRWIAVGGTVLYHDPYQPERGGAAKSRDLDSLLAEVDVLSIHVPLTQETRGLIAERELALMRDGAVLVNTSRGEVVKSSALRAALASGHLGGAGLDVWDPEPMEPDEPLLGYPNVLTTPHYAGYSEESFDELRDRVLRQVLQVQRGELPEWTLNGVQQLRIA